MQMTQFTTKSTRFPCNISPCQKIPIRHHHPQHLQSPPPKPSRDTLLHKTTMASGPTNVLSVITPYSIKGKICSQSVRDQWHIIDNDPQLRSIWSNSPITTYHKTESLKDILIHSHQGKATYLLHRTIPKQNH